MTKLIQITDFHLQAESDDHYQGVLPEHRFNSVLESVASHHPDLDLLLMTGDLAHHGYSSAYQRISSSVRSRSFKAVRWLPGNHDNAELMSTYVNLSNKQTDLGSWLVITLDTTARPDGKGRGAITRNELQALSHTLADLSEQYVCIAMHHNPVQLGSQWQHPIMLENADEFWQTIEPYSAVKLVLCGHLHQEHQVRFQNVTLLSSPATAHQFKPGLCDFELEQDAVLSQPAYRVITLHSDGSFETEIVRVPS